MRDGRGAEVEQDVASAIRHFAAAQRLSREEPVAEDSWEGYRARMSLMHAMQAGHTSLESALLRIFDMRREQRPTGDAWPADLIRRASRALESRPAVLPPGLARAADRTRRFRHVAVRTYDHFEPDEAQAAIASAGVLADGLAEAIREFREAAGE